MKQNEWDILKIIEFSQKKYKTVFNPSVFLKAVVFFEDAESQIIDSIEWKWEDIKFFFITEVEKYLTKDL